MTQPRDDERIAHMVEACEEGMAFVVGRARADLDDDRVLQLALCKLIENVGEAAKAVTPEFRAKYPGVEWSSAARMRDRVVHHYFQIDLDIVWSTVSEDFPTLLAALRAEGVRTLGRAPRRTRRVNGR